MFHAKSSSAYPFGLNMEGNWQGGLNGQNKYQYNGKELNQDFGLDWNDYGARFYDAAIGRWTTIDPLSEMYCNFSNYHYVLNNPINLIDPTGMSSEAYSFGMKNNDDSKDSKITTTVVNTETKETYTINDGYDFTFKVNNDEFKEIKDKGKIVGTSSYGRWVKEATTDLMRTFLNILARNTKKLTTETAESLDEGFLDGAGEDAINGHYSKAAMMLAMSRIPGGGKVSGWISRKVFKTLSKPMQKKFIAAMQKGIVGPKDQSGVIILEESEKLYKEGYRYKLKITGHGGDSRIYGKAMENGHILYDFIRGH